VDGEEGVLTSGLSFGYAESLPDADEHEVEVTNSKPRSKSNVAVAYYTRADGEDDDELDYPAESSLGELVASGVGDAGEESMTQTFTTDTLDLNLTATCQVPGLRMADANARLRLRIEIDGREVWKAWCGPPRQVINGSYFSPERTDETLDEAWRRLDMTKDDEHEVRLTLVGERTQEPLPTDTRIGFAMYDAPGEPIVQDGVHLRTVERVGGKSYSLAGRETVRVDQSRSLSKVIPGGHDEVLIVYGHEGGPVANNAWVPLLDGNQFGTNVNVTDSGSWKRLRDGSRHTLEVRARKHVPGGAIYAAYYLPEK
ncbi:MAG: hypothetical protein L0K86_11240, partial [Actinomycetia bacterium]|nr:hypothetical protein [Actinomycetes bacterium]